MATTVSGFRRSWILPLVLVAVPSAIWLVVALFNGWIPNGDNAWIAMRTHDVFSTHPPLLGMPTTAHNEVEGLSVFHPGPIQFVLMAPIYWASGWSPWGLLLASLVLNLSLVALSLRSVWKIGSPTGISALVTSTLVVFVVLQHRVAEPWNPYPVAIGLVTVVLLGWRVLLGHTWQWPSLIVVVSVVVQGHVLGAPLGIVAVGTVLALTVKHSVPAPSIGEWVLSFTVFVLSWAFPLWEMVVNWPGNPGALLTYLISPREGEPFQLMNLGWAVTLGIEALVIGAALRWRIKRKNRSTVGSDDRALVNELVPVVDLLIPLLGALFFVSLLGGPYRFFYAASGLPLLAFSFLLVMRSRPTGWWTRLTGVSAGTWVVLVAFSLVLTPVAKTHGANSKDLNKLASQVVSLVSGHESPVAVSFKGPLVGSFGPAVVASLLAAGVDVRYDSGWRDVDWDQQRRLDTIDGEHLELALVEHRIGDLFDPDVDDPTFRTEVVLEHANATVWVELRDVDGQVVRGP